METTGLFQYSPYRSDQVVPAYADLDTDPIGQVVATITAYLPEGTGSSGYDWQRTAFLRADFARAKVEHVWTDDGQYYIEGEWGLDTSDDEVRDWLLLFSSEKPSADSFAVLAAQAPDLAIAPPGPDVRGLWGEDGAFAAGVPGEDWPGPDDQ